VNITRTLIELPFYSTSAGPFPRLTQNAVADIANFFVGEGLLVGLSANSECQPFHGTSICVLLCSAPLELSIVGINRLAGTWLLSLAPAFAITKVRD
jgi:hypothetical protein